MVPCGGRKRLLNGRNIKGALWEAENVLYLDLSVVIRTHTRKKSLNCILKALIAK